MKYKTEWLLSPTIIVIIAFLIEIFFGKGKQSPNEMFGWGIALGMGLFFLIIYPVAEAQRRKKLYKK
ncbi:MAG: hypothetical protein ACTSUM_03760 [Alphaproteobacteria bacterium]